MDMNMLIYGALLFVPGGTVIGTVYYLASNKKLGAQNLTSKDVVDRQAPVKGFGFQNLAPEDEEDVK